MTANTKARLYLHIGTPKTGTTAIQNFLPMNRDLLEEQGFCYPDLGYRFYGVNQYRNAHFLVHRKICEPESEAEVRKAEDERFYEGLDKIKELTNFYPNIIMSDENIWNGYKNRENFWQILKSALSERGIDLKVIVYLRRQDLVVESYYAQRVKIKINDNFQDYLDSEDIMYFKLDYYTQLKEIEQAIGKENIIVRVYEKKQYEGNGNTLISDFLNTLGLELDERYVSSDIVVNTRLQGKYLEIKRILNRIDCFRTRKNNWTAKYLKVIQDEEEKTKSSLKCAYFTYEQRIAFLEKYKDGNEAIAREFLNREDGILFRAGIRKRDWEYNKSYSSEELVLICGKMLELHNEDMKNKLASMKSELDSVKRQLEYAKRPLKKKIASKIYKTLFKYD